MVDAMSDEAGKATRCEACGVKNAILASMVTFLFCLFLFASNWGEPARQSCRTLLADEWLQTNAPWQAAHVQTICTYSREDRIR